MNTNTRMGQTTGYAAILSGIAAIFALVTLIMFFSLESASAGEGSTRPRIWGPLSDIFPIIQMALLLVVARALHAIQQPAAQRLSLFGTVIGVAGMLGVVVLQTLLRLQLISFEQEVGLVVFATGLVGVWLLIANYLCRRGRTLPSRLAMLGMAVGVAFMLEPVILFIAGGAGWRAAVSNVLLLAVGVIVFLLAYMGFPVWAFGLGRVFLAKSASMGSKTAEARA